MIAYLASIIFFLWWITLHYVNSGECIQFPFWQATFSVETFIKAIMATCFLKSSITYKPDMEYEQSKKSVFYSLERVRMDKQDKTETKWSVLPLRWES